jgi:hypothetical protein
MTETAARQRLASITASLMMHWHIHICLCWVQHCRKLIAVKHRTIVLAQSIAPLQGVASPGTAAAVQQAALRVAESNMTSKSKWNLPHKHLFSGGLGELFGSSVQKLQGGSS